MTNNKRARTKYPCIRARDAARCDASRRATDGLERPANGVARPIGSTVEAWQRVATHSRLPFLYLSGHNYFLQIGKKVSTFATYSPLSDLFFDRVCGFDRCMRLSPWSIARLTVPGGCNVREAGKQGATGAKQTKLKFPLTVFRTTLNGVNVNIQLRFLYVSQYL